MDVHLVPRRVNYFVPQKFKAQVCLLCFFPDVTANIVALLNKLVLFVQINDEIVAFESLNFSYSFVLAQKVTELLLDHSELIHNLLFKLLLLLSICRLEFLLHDVSKKFHIIWGNRDHLRKNRHFIGALGRDCGLRVLRIVD